MMGRHLIFDVDTKGERSTTKGLEPLRTRVTLISVKSNDFERIITSPDEKEILEEFWGLVRSKDYVLVGFNCHAFDIPVLYIRSLVNGVKVVNLKGRCIDLRQVLSNDMPKIKGTLDEYGTQIGYPFSMSGFSKSNLGIHWKGNRIPELTERLIEDARLTFALFKRVKEAGLLG